MQTQNASDETNGQGAVQLKGSSFTKYVNLKKGNLNLILNQAKSIGDADPDCVEVCYLPKLHEMAQKVTLLNLYPLYAGLELKIRKKLDALKNEGVNPNMAEEFLATDGVVKKATVLYDEMIAKGDPIIVVSVRDVKIGIQLLEKRNHCLIVRKYQHSLSRDNDLLIQVENEYENLAALHKLPRRTKAIMRKKLLETII